MREVISVAKRLIERERETLFITACSSSPQLCFNYTLIADVWHIVLEVAGYFQGYRTRFHPRNSCSSSGLFTRRNFTFPRIIIS